MTCTTTSSPRTDSEWSYRLRPVGRLTTVGGLTVSEVSRVTPPIEGRVQPYGNDLQSQLHADHALSDGNHIGIIMRPPQSG